MKDQWQKMGIIGFGVWCLVVAVVASGSSNRDHVATAPTGAVIPIGAVLPAKYGEMNSVTSYWADPHHIVCCFQGYSANGDRMTTGRRCMIYEYPAGRNWRLPILDSRTSSQDGPNDQEWEFIGLSKDCKQLFVDISGDWYSTPALQVTARTTKQPPKWTHVAYSDYVEGGFVPSLRETANETPNNIPVIDRFKGIPGYDSKSLSPSGLQIAWIDMPGHDLWISNTNGSHSHYLGALYQSGMTDYDVRWSPDEKYISCLSTLVSPISGSNKAGLNDFRLTVYDAGR